jgi:hypothetical protein
LYYRISLSTVNIFGTYGFRTPGDTADYHLAINCGSFARPTFEPMFPVAGTPYQGLAKSASAVLETCKSAPLATGGAGAASHEQIPPVSLRSRVGMTNRKKGSAHVEMAPCKQPFARSI